MAKLTLLVALLFVGIIVDFSVAFRRYPSFEDFLEQKYHDVEEEYMERYMEYMEDEEYMDDTDDKRCALSTGDGKGVKEINVGTRTRSECIDECLKRKKEDDSINGITVSANSADKKCYCEKRMTGRNNNKGWKSCYLQLPGPPPAAAPKYEYNFVNVEKSWYDARDACRDWGGYLAIIRSQAENDYLTKELKNRNILSSWIGLNDLKREGTFLWNKGDEVPTFTSWAVGQPNNHRNQDCTELLTINQYNGNLGDGTWSDLSCSSPKRSYTCQKKKVAAAVKCDIVNGNGVGGTKVKVGNQKGEDCVEACYQKSLTDREINGATWYYVSNRAGCWCWKKMAYTNKQLSYKTCFLFGPPPPPAPMACSFKTGEGTGGSLLYIGRYVEKDCIDSCLKRGVFDKSINGVTMNKDATIKGCWCQQNMKGWDTNSRKKTCRFAAAPDSQYEYKFVTGKVNWYDATAGCNSWGGNLVIIRSMEQNDYITEELKKRNMVATLIGLDDRQKEGTFVWAKDGETSSFRNWGVGQPNNYINQDCVVLVVEGGSMKEGKWGDVNCYGEKTAYVCEKKKN